MGTIKGTAMGEVNRFVMQYKNFSVSLYKKILEEKWILMDQMKVN